MTWKFESDRPIYTQILEQMSERIITGYYKPGSKLDSVRNLATQAGVNPNTMQRALVELESQGYVVTNRTTGRTVTEDVDIINQSKNKMAQVLTKNYVKKMVDLGYNKEQIVSVIKEEE